MRYSALHTAEYVACYRLSDSGEDAKEKGTRKDRRTGTVLPLCLRFLNSADPTKSRSLEQATEYAMDFQAF